MKKVQNWLKKNILEKNPKSKLNKKFSKNFTPGSSDSTVNVKITYFTHIWL